MAVSSQPPARPPPWHGRPPQSSPSSRCWRGNPSARTASAPGSPAPAPRSAAPSGSPGVSQPPAPSPQHPNPPWGAPPCHPSAVGTMGTVGTSACPRGPRGPAPLCPRALAPHLLQDFGDHGGALLVEHLGEDLQPRQHLVHLAAGRGWASAQRPSVCPPARPSVPSARRPPVQPLAGGDQGLVEVGEAAGPRPHRLQVQRVAALQVLVGDAGEAVGAAEGAG